MSKENAKKFLRFMAKECGQFTKEEMDEAMKEMQGGASPELSDEELKDISGGTALAAAKDQHDIWKEK